MTPPSISPFKPILVRGTALGKADTPAICVPLIGSSHASLLAEVKSLLPQQPDIFEWRADGFEGITSLDAVADVALALRRALGQTPMIFTVRSAREGGAPQRLTESATFGLIRKMAASTLFDFVDIELALSEVPLLSAIHAAQEAGTQVILSSHDFAATPPSAELMNRLQRAKSLGADVAKLAVMPVNPADVLRLMQVTHEARCRFDMPLITMSMGQLGVASRAMGHLFGSSMTFAAGLAASAPGQLPIDEVRKVFEVLRSRTLPR